MKTLRWIAAAILVSLTMGVGAARAHDRDDDCARFNRGLFYGNYYVSPYYGYGGYERPGYYGYSRDEGRWGRDRDRGRYARHDEHRGGFRFGFGF